MKIILPAAWLLVVLAIACNRAELNKEPQTAAADKSDRRLESADTVAGPANAGGAPGAGQSQPAANPDWDKKIVKTANISVETKSFKFFTARLHDKVKAAGGYIAKEAQATNEQKIENTVMIKVPVDRFDEMVMQLPSDSDRLVSKEINSEDVTMQLVDTKSQLETKKEVRLRYLELLRQAHTMKDILAVQNEINDIQEQMDGATGRIAYLSHAATYSTINLTYYQLLEVTVRDNTEPDFLHKIGNAFKDGWNWVSALMIGVVGLWPLLLAALLGLMWWRKRPRRSAKSSVS